MWNAYWRSAMFYKNNIVKKITCFLVLVCCAFVFNACSKKKPQKNDEEVFCLCFKTYAYYACYSAQVGEIKDITVYKDNIGGVLAEITIDCQTDAGYKIKETYYLVMAEIMFSAEEITLSKWSEDLYKETINQHDGKKIEKGYFIERLDMEDIGTDKYSPVYDRLLNWKILQAEYYEIEYDVEKINQILKNN